MKSLVGYTGFVGSNMLLNTNFDKTYNSKNICEAYDTRPELLIYSGIRAEKFLANKEPEKDLAIVNDAIENIKKIKPKILVLISTIDVYKNPINVDEDTIIETENLHPYGLNRYRVEEWIENNLNNYLIVRLPGLYGKNIKKNFIFDLINVIPAMLTETKYCELAQQDNIISQYYEKQENGFFKCKELSGEERTELKIYFKNIGFSALNFTDSRGIFQFYNLAYLWQHIETSLKHNVKKINLATEPVSISELYRYIIKSDFVNEISKIPPCYNFMTKHYNLFKGKDGYIFDKNFVLEDIKRFIGEVNL